MLTRRAAYLRCIRKPPATRSGGADATRDD